jgi:hypothetical protein
VTGGDERGREQARAWSRRTPETGIVTAELAVGLVSLLLVLAMVLGGLRAGMDRAAAASVAGLLAREVGHSGPTAGGELWSDVRRRLPAGSSMTMTVGSGLVVVQVRVPVRAGVARQLLPDAVTVEAVARDERG